MRLEQEAVWLTLHQMAEFFERAPESVDSPWLLRCRYDDDGLSLG